jgi:hypothetical protein
MTETDDQFVQRLRHTFDLPTYHDLQRYREIEKRERTERFMKILRK